MNCFPFGTGLCCRAAHLLVVIDYISKTVSIYCLEQLAREAFLFYFCGRFETVCGLICTGDHL